jgi:hypothetical protein
MEVYAGADVYIYVLLSSAIVGECWALCPGRFTTREFASLDHWILGWVSLRTGMHAEEKEISW